MTPTIGITCASGQLASESAKWLKVPFPPISQSYPGQDTVAGPNNNWALQMWSNYFVTELTGCKQVVITLPLLFGTGWNIGCTGHTMSPQAPTDTTGKGNFPTLMTLTDVAAGAWDNMYRPCFKMIAAKFPSAALRLGQEDWTKGYAWTGQSLEALRTQARNHLITVALEESPNFTFIWDVGRSGPGGYNPAVTGLAKAQHVGLIGFDLYDNTPLSNALTIISGAAALGKKVGRPVICSEWGLEGKDDPAWGTGVFNALESEVGTSLYYDKDNSALALYPKAGPAVAALMAKAV
jgi:hypothetical protein